MLPCDIHAQMVSPSVDATGGQRCAVKPPITHTQLELDVREAQERYDRLCLLRRSKAAAEALKRLRAARHAVLAAEVGLA